MEIPAKWMAIAESYADIIRGLETLCMCVEKSRLKSIECFRRHAMGPLGRIDSQLFPLPFILYYPTAPPSVLSYRK